MARGWESKSVEAQQAEAWDDASAPRPRLSPEAAAQLRRRETLQLSRKRVLHDLESSQNPRRREMLEGALAVLDAQLRELQ